ncbi:MAG TPA: replicative DNA helicase [bacterium]|nr:replicative DNA helicase [bacterium]
MGINPESISIEEVLRRVPPSAPEVEMAVLGAMMRDSAASVEVIELLRVEDFYKPAHRKIFLAMQELFQKNEPIDIATVASELERTSELVSAGGRTYLVDIADSVFTSANAKTHAQIVLEKSLLRQLLAAASEIEQKCFGAFGDIGNLLDETEKVIFEIAGRRLHQDFSRIGEVLPHTFEQIERYRTQGGGITGLSTGFKDLDALTGGLHSTDLVVLAGRPSMGKTAFALNIVENIALSTGKGCAVFSLEMSKEQLAERLLSSHARVSAHNLRTGRLRNEEYARLNVSAGMLYETKIFVDDSAALGILELRAKARRLKAQHDISLVVIDYLQMMHGPRSLENRQQEISLISRSLKALAKELKVPVLALSQLSRQVEQRGGDRRPQLADLRESGAIEQDADVVMFVYRPERYGITEEKGQSLENTAEIIVGKQRNGPTGTVLLTFLKEFTRFENRADTRTVGVPPPTVSAAGAPPDDAPF